MHKVGRSTGMTSGVINGVKSTVNLLSTHEQTSEWTVQGDGDEPFAAYGDSGSILWNDGGDAVGLLWGSNPSEKVNFVTPMESIIDAIEYRTGKRYRIKMSSEDDEVNELTIIPGGRKVVLVDSKDTEEVVGESASPPAKDVMFGLDIHSSSCT